MTENELQKIEQSLNSVSDGNPLAQFIAFDVRSLISEIRNLHKALRYYAEIGGTMGAKARKALGQEK